jgi:hypothetical protein
MMVCYTVCGSNSKQEAAAKTVASKEQNGGLYEGQM